MTNLELNEIKKEFDIKNNILTRNYLKDDEKLELLYNNSYYSIVKANFPLDFATKIYNKYPNRKYHIRVDGKNDFDAPTDDVLKYYVDTKEGLVILLSEYLDYKSKKKTNKLNIRERIDNINKNILNKVNPREKGEEWVKKIDPSAKIIASPFRILLEKFDYAVNPFLDREINLENSSYLNLSADLKEDGSSFLIFNNERGNTYYKRDNNGYCFGLEYKLLNGIYSTFIVTHSYNCGITDKMGEKIGINLLDNNGKLTNIEYNLTDDFIKKVVDGNKKIYNKDNEKIKEILKYAITLASSITSDNIILNEEINKSHKKIKSLTKKLKK